MSAARLPVPGTILGLAAAGIAATAIPALGIALRFDRSAIATGETWRLMTGSLVHFGAAHLALDLAALMGAAAVAEHRGQRGFAAMCLAALVAVGAAVLTLAPGIAVYGGLSGVATGGIVYVALGGVAVRGPWRWVCAAVLALLALKLAMELRVPTFLLLDAAEVVPVPVSHAAGAATAAAYAGAEAAWRYAARTGRGARPGRADSMKPPPRTRSPS